MATVSVRAKTAALIDTRIAAFISQVSTSGHVDDAPWQVLLNVASEKKNGHHPTTRSVRGVHEGRDVIANFVTIDAADKGLLLVGGWTFFSDNGEIIEHDDPPSIDHPYFQELVAHATAVWKADCRWLTYLYAGLASFVGAIISLILGYINAETMLWPCIIAAAVLLGGFGASYWLTTQVPDVLWNWGKNSKVRVLRAVTKAPKEA